MNLQELKGLGARLLSTALIASCVSCSAVRLLKASEARDHGFLPHPELLSDMSDHRPFNKSWIYPDKKKYEGFRMKNKVLYIAPVNTTILEQDILREYPDDETARLDRIEEARELSDYFYHKLKLVIDNYENHPLKAVLIEEPRSFSLNTAIVELDATSPAINVIGTAAGVFVPGGGLIKIAGKGGVAIEGYLKESETGELLEQFKDRESDKAAPFTVKDFQRYAHVRTSLDDWAMQLAEITAKPVGEEVQDSLPFSLNPF